MLAAVGVWLSGFFLLLPLHGYAYATAWLLLTIGLSYIFRLYNAEHQPVTICLDASGGLTWQGDASTSGRLSTATLLSVGWLQLVWVDNLGKQHGYWLFRDQVSDHDYRALARVLQLLRWQDASANDKQD